MRVGKIFSAVWLTGSKTALFSLSEIVFFPRLQKISATLLRLQKELSGVRDRVSLHYCITREVLTDNKQKNIQLCFPTALIFLESFLL
jgi:hypothetical protein